MKSSPIHHGFIRQVILLLDILSSVSEQQACQLDSWCCFRCCGTTFERSFNLRHKGWRVTLYPSSSVPSPILCPRLAPSILYVVSFSPSYVVLSLKCAFHFSIQLDGLDPSWMLFMCTSYFVVSFSLAYQWCTTSNVFCSVLWHYLRPSELSVYQPCHCLNCSMTLTATSPSFCYVTLLWPLHFRPATSLLCCHFALVLPRHSRAVTSLLCCHVTLALPRRSQSCLSITFLTCLWLYRYVCLWPLGIPS